VLVMPSIAAVRVVSAAGREPTSDSSELNKSPKKQPYITHTPKHSAKMAASTTQADLGPGVHSAIESVKAVD
jgi:N-acetyl-gamma-glutamylphosphate reductase